MSLKSELQEILRQVAYYGEEAGGSIYNPRGITEEEGLAQILDLLDKSLPSHKRQVHVEHGEIMPSVAQCKWYFDGYEQAIADFRKVIKEAK
jgi:hypothetical protein